MLTNMVSTGQMSWSRLVEVMAVNPRAILRCAPVRIEAGGKADLTLIDPHAQVEVTKDYFESKSKNSAFLGAKLTGAATDVLLDGWRSLADGVVQSR
jgi:dihydroorotase